MFLLALCFKILIKTILAWRGLCHGSNRADASPPGSEGCRLAPPRAIRPGTVARSRTATALHHPRLRRSPLPLSTAGNITTLLLSFLLIVIYDYSNLLSHDRRAVSCKPTGFYELLWFSGVFKTSDAQITGTLFDLRHGMDRCSFFWRQK